MNLDNDILLVSSRLSIPLSEVQRLPLQQTRNLLAVTSLDPHSSLLQCVAKLSPTALGEALQAEGLSQSKGTLSFRGLINCLARQGVVLTAKEQQQLLPAISRCPETSLISLPLFLTLHRYWTKILSSVINDNNITDERRDVKNVAANKISLQNASVVSDPHGSSFDPQKARTRIELQRPDLVPSLELAYHRSQHAGSAWNENLMVSREYFFQMLNEVEVRLSKDSFDELMQLFLSTGVSTPPRGDIYLPYFLSVAKPQKQLNPIYQERQQNTPLPPNPTVAYNDNDDHSANKQRSLLFHRLLSKISSCGILIMRGLLENNQAKYVTEDSLSTALKACGIPLGAGDMRHLWMNLLHQNEPSSLGDIGAGGGGKIPIDVFAKQIGVDMNKIWPAPPAPYRDQDASTQKPLISALMRDEPRVLRAKKAGEPSATTTTIANCFQMLPPQPPSASNTVSPALSTFGSKVSTQGHHEYLPWQKKEDDSFSNVISRVRVRLVEGQKTTSVLSMLRKRESECGNTLSRYILAETLTANGVRLSGGDAESIWEAFCQFCRLRGERLTTSTFSIWMNLVDESSFIPPSPPSIPSSSSSSSSSSQSAFPDFPHVNSTSPSRTIARENRMVQDNLSLLVPPTLEIGTRSLGNDNTNHTSDFDSRFDQESLIFTRPKSSLSTSFGYQIAESDSGTKTCEKRLDDKHRTVSSPVSLSHAARSDNHRYHHVENSNLPQTMASLLTYDNTSHQDSNHQNQQLQSTTNNANLESREACIKKLQGMRVAIATVFRKSTRGSSLHDNSIKCIDLARALLEAPFSLPLTLENAWRLVCDMASMPYDSHTEGENAASLIYTDVTGFLDKEESWKGSGGIKNVPNRGGVKGVAGVSEQQCLRNIRSHLMKSSLVKGNKLLLLGLTSVLRHKLRLALEKGQSSYDGSPDTCSPQELLKLLSSIDVHITLPESKFICECAETISAEGNNNGHNAIDQKKGGGRISQGVGEGVRLGAAIIFLGTLLE